MSTPTHFAERIDGRQVGLCRVLMLQTPVDNVVSWRGSFITNPDFGAGHDLLQDLTVSLLDKGTEQRDRFELAQVLEDRGAKLNLSSDGLYVDVSGQALAGDLPDVLDVLAEMLRSPQFDATEFEKEKAQSLAQVQRQMEKTGAQASGALARQLFPDTHPNYTTSFEAQIEQLQRLTVDDVRRFHARHVGANEFALVFVGDVNREAILGAVEAAFGDWASHDAPVTYATDPASAAPGRTPVPMPDKSNVDVRMGHALPIRRDHDDYEALYVGNYILGGNFSARLMNQVRDEQGLTYHIGSGLSGVTTRYAGSWQVEVTLSQDTLATGIDATEAVIRQFVEQGATADELEGKKTTITGSYTVGLATTKRLAQSILTNAERGFDMDYLDRFPARIDALTLEEVNAAIRRHVRPDDLHVALAGTLPEAEPAQA
jgi:predicted Zn-dependent peptidase